MEIVQETVHKYKTADGKVFDTEEEAKNHEDELKSFNIAIYLPNGKVLNKEDIKGFFYRCECNECPFMVECHNMKNIIRKHTTATFSLCDIIVF